MSRAVQSGSTFLHSVIKLTNKTNSKLQNSSSAELDSHLAVVRAVFNLLSNLALSAECRGVFWKVGLRIVQVITVTCAPAKRTSIVGQQCRGVLITRA